MVFTAGVWASTHGQMWQNAAQALRNRGVEIYAFGIEPGAREDQLQSITFKPENALLITDYVLPEPIPTGVTGNIIYCTLIKPFGDSYNDIMILTLLEMQNCKWFCSRKCA